jgi:hypothetical protein
MSQEKIPSAPAGFISADPNNQECHGAALHGKKFVFFFSFLHSFCSVFVFVATGLNLNKTDH